VSSDNMSNTGVRYQVSGIMCQVITCQVPVSDIKCQVSGAKYNMLSTGVRSQVSESGVKYNMSIYHATDVKIVITRYEMIAKYEVTQETYSA